MLHVFNRNDRIRAGRQSRPGRDRLRGAAHESGRLLTGEADDLDAPSRDEAGGAQPLA